MTEGNFQSPFMDNKNRHHSSSSTHAGRTPMAYPASAVRPRQCRCLTGWKLNPSRCNADSIRACCRTKTSTLSSKDC